MVGKISCKQDNLVLDACFLVLCQKYLNNASYIFITAVLQKKPYVLSTWSAAPQWFYSAKNNNSWKRSASSGLFPYSTIKKPEFLKQRMFSCITKTPDRILRSIGHLNKVVPVVIVFHSFLVIWAHSQTQQE